MYVNKCENVYEKIFLSVLYFQFVFTCSMFAFVFRLVSNIFFCALSFHSFQRHIVSIICKCILAVRNSMAVFAFLHSTYRQIDCNIMRMFRLLGITIKNIIVACKKMFPY